MAPDRISLPQVENVYPEGLPIVEQPPKMGGPVSDLLATEHPHGLETRDESYAFGVALNEIRRLGRALRRGRKFGSVLQVLLMADGLTCGQIAGQLGADPRDVESELSSLESIGIVRSQQTTSTFPRYSVVGLDQPE